MTCEKCNSKHEIEEHHIHPKFMDNISGYGKKVDLCKKHHNILHLIIPARIWKFIDKKNKFKAIKDVKNFTEYYISQIERNKNVMNSVKFFIERGYLLDKESLEFFRKHKPTEKLLKSYVLKFEGQKVIIFDNLKEVLKEDDNRK